MKKALIICAAGMSSSIMAQKTTDYLKGKGHDIQIDAISATEGETAIKNSDYDLFLISPQTKMYMDRFQKAADEVNKPITLIPFQAYVPIPTGIEKLGDVVLEKI